MFIPVYFVSDSTMLFMLCSAIPVGIVMAIYKAYIRRKFRRLKDECERLKALRDREGEKCAQQKLTEWTQKLHPRAVDELEQWCAKHPSAEGLARAREKEDREKWRREDEEWVRKQWCKNRRR